jgi:hypothetical protein
VLQGLVIGKSLLRLTFRDRPDARFVSLATKDREWSKAVDDHCEKVRKCLDAADTKDLVETGKQSLLIRTFFRLQVAKLCARVTIS